MADLRLPGRDAESPAVSLSPAGAWRRARLGLWLALALCLPSAPARAALQVTDDRGVSVSLITAPQRIVSLLPSLTETVCELGACSRLVGVDRYSNYPPQVKSLPQLGGGIDPSIEAIVALRPDLVLMATSGRGIERLEALGIKVLALEPKDGADVRRVLEQVGQVLQVRDAQRVWRSIDAAVLAAAQSLPARSREARVYFEASRGPYAAGPKSFIGEVMQRLGLRNIIAPEWGAFPLISPEHVVRADPDVIMMLESNAAELQQRPGWSNMRAVRERRLCVFSAEQGDVLARPGPRMAQAAQLIANCVAEKTGELRP